MKSWQKYVMPVLVLVLAGIVAHDRIFVGRGDRVGPEPKVGVDAAALGRAHGPVVVRALADAWEAAALSVEGGGSVAEAASLLQDRWRTARVEAFTAKVAPEFAKVLPEGTEPQSPEQRAAVVSLWRDFARGLGGKR
ncbi:MAG: hypothetical protein SFX72_04895 [Isosphaeraceae bacterium]|nr:hypothetical protein [Isosphaeraceae bacterium]